MGRGRITSSPEEKYLLLMSETEHEVLIQLLELAVIVAWFSHWQE